MKKLFAVLLVAVTLCSFAGIGASAVRMTEEEAWEKIEQIQEIINSGTFTVIEGNEMLVVDGNRSAIEKSRLTLFDHVIASQLLGERQRLVSTSKGNYLVLPKLRIYAKIGPFQPIELSLVDAMHHLWHTEDPDNVVFNYRGRDQGYAEEYLTVELQWDSVYNEYLKENTPYLVKYDFENGKLRCISRDSMYLWVSELTPQADGSYFSTKDMIRLPWLLMRILTFFAGIDYRFYF